MCMWSFGGPMLVVGSGTGFQSAVALFGDGAQFLARG